MAEAGVLALIDGIGEKLRVKLARQGIDNAAMVGIHTGGAWVAGRLYEQLGLADPLGTLDISFYRDDFTRIGMNPQVRPSQIPFDVDDRHIVLVDDVLQTGRTIRAALNEIFDYGRPASVMLVTLLERGGRELPIEAHVTGLSPPLQRHEQIKLNGPDPLELVIVEKGQPSVN
jgi:pyrimidine operon attenuation protein/uracil phosphoribosyltransferase